MTELGKWIKENADSLLDHGRHHGFHVPLLHGLVRSEVKSVTGSGLARLGEDESGVSGRGALLGGSEQAGIQGLQLPPVNP